MRKVKKLLLLRFHKKNTQPDNLLSNVAKQGNVFILGMWVGAQNPCSTLFLLVLPHYHPWPHLALHHIAKNPWFELALL